jgi:hypothetical protein
MKIKESIIGAAIGIIAALTTFAYLYDKYSEPEMPMIYYSMDDK